MTTDDARTAHLARFMNARDGVESGTVAWDDLDDAGRESYLNDAHLVIEALRRIDVALTPPDERNIMTSETTTLTAADFEMKYDADHTFPFFESENGTIMGYGHPGKAEFAALVKQYDDLCNGSEAYPEPHSPDEVQHVWGVVDNAHEAETGEWRVSWAGVTAETPGAFPMTVIFR